MLLMIYLRLVRLEMEIKEYDRWFLERRSFFVDSEKNSFEVFLDEIEIGDCFPENEYLAKKIFCLLRKRYNF